MVVVLAPAAPASNRPAANRAPASCAGQPATITGTAGDDVLNGTSGPDVIAALGGNDTINGGGGQDIICGGSGVDTLRGGTGDDFLLGGVGSDTINGGADIDAILFATSTSGVFVNLSTGISRTSAEGTDTLKEIEIAVGTGGADRMVGGQSASPSFLAGLGGDDTYVGGATLTLVAFLSGNSVDASLRDGVAHGEGRDRLKGIDGLVGSNGPDTLIGSTKANVILGRGGKDTVSGGANNDVLSGGPGDDRISGGPGADRIDGDAGNDAIDGGKGSIDTADYSTSASGVDVSLKKRIAKGDGNDKVRGVERLYGSPFHDVLIGNKRSNSISGGSGADKLFGLAGKDALEGGAGNNVLIGGSGKDGCFDGDQRSCETRLNPPHKGSKASGAVVRTAAGLRHPLGFHLSGAAEASRAVTGYMIQQPGQLVCGYDQGGGPLFNDPHEDPHEGQYGIVATPPVLRPEPGLSQEEVIIRPELWAWENTSTGWQWVFSSYLDTLVGYTVADLSSYSAHVGTVQYADTTTGQVVTNDFTWVKPGTRLYWQVRDEVYWVSTDGQSVVDSTVITEEPDADTNWFYVEYYENNGTTTTNGPYCDTMFAG
jgi:hypothetical protein